MKRFLPAAHRAYIKGRLQEGRYLALRSAGRLMFPMIGAIAPLRGFEYSTKEYIAEGGGEYRQIDAPTGGSPETFVASIPRGRAAFDYGVAITRHHTLLTDVSPQLGSPPRSHAALFASRLPSVKEIRGAVAVISSTAHQRYFHWMFDVLPRFNILKRSGLKADRYIINDEKRYQRETLDMMRIDRNAIVSPSLDSQVEAENLILPSLPGTIGIVTPRTCRFLRDTFLPTTSSRPPSRLLYISRKDALTRRVVNESELRVLLRRNHFEIVELDGRSVAEQIEMFADARVIIGPHGAGFTNLVFCSPGATLIEFMPSTYFNPCFEVLAELVSVRYRRMGSSSVSTHEHDICVDINELEGAIKTTQ